MDGIVRNIPFTAILCGLGISLVSFCTAGCNREATSTVATSERTESAELTSDDSAYGTHEPIDPVAVNGPIFEDWPQPDGALVISGEMLGYLEPCGCAGLENQKGGFSRRDSLLKQLAGKDWPLAKIDLGGQIRRFGTQAGIKFSTALQGLRKMEYGAVGIGATDLQLPAERLLSEVIDEENPFVAANVGFNPENDLFAGIEFAKPFRVIECGSKKIGVTSVVGPSYQAQVSNPDLQITPAADALENVLPELDSQKCDAIVVLSYGKPEESEQLAREFPEQIDWIVTAGGADEPPAQWRAVEGSKARLVEVGHKGMYLAVIGFYDDEEMPIRFQRVPLDSRFPDSEAMNQLMVEYQSNLELTGFEDLGLRPIANHNGNFMGAESCKDCHQKQYSIWRGTGHARATESIIEIAKPSRIHDPECVSCHVTGWNPQKYFPYETGFESIHATPHLVANGCENCHGPATEHVAAELDKERGQLERNQLQAALKLSKEQAFEQVCMTCHDKDNSPDFDPELYWPKVAHGKTVKWDKSLLNLTPPPTGH